MIIKKEYIQFQYDYQKRFSEMIQYREDKLTEPKKKFLADRGKMFKKTLNLCYKELKKKHKNIKERNDFLEKCIRQNKRDWIATVHHYVDIYMFELEGIIAKCLVEGSNRNYENYENRKEEEEYQSLLLIEQDLWESDVTEIPKEKKT